MTPGEKLCLACGLCCDGTLFDNVRLGTGDDPKKLRGLGLPVAITRSRPPIPHFPQPCAALCADRTCRLYAERPGQCRTFECGVFLAAHAGRIDFAAAHRLVKRTRRQAEEIRRLLRELGNHEEHLPLSERFRRTQRRLESGAADAAAGETFAEVSVAMHRLTLLAHDKFYTKPPRPAPDRTG